MMDDPTAGLFLAVLLAGAVVFCAAPLLLARLWAVRFGLRTPGPVKDATYECGLESKGDAWIQFKSAYYLYAIVFLIFDVEAVFVLPFAVSFGRLSVGAVLAMALFLLLLAEGLAWAWWKGLLNWDAPPAGKGPGELPDAAQR
jgi:NADH-quinone oxidoreductase subunit A